MLLDRGERWGNFRRGVFLRESFGEGVAQAPGCSLAGGWLPPPVPTHRVWAMLKPALVAEVRRLLAEGKLSQRAIARRLGVSRGSVHAIARGKRPDRQPAEPLEEIRWEGPPARCPGCGGMVFLPCRACTTRQAAARRPRARWPDGDEPLGLQLTEEHRRRYEEVRRWRQMRQEACGLPASDPAGCSRIR